MTTTLFNFTDDQLDDHCPGYYEIYIIYKNGKPSFQYDYYSSLRACLEAELPANHDDIFTVFVHSFEED